MTTAKIIRVNIIFFDFRAGKDVLKHGTNNMDHKVYQGPGNFAPWAAVYVCT